MNTVDQKKNSISVSMIASNEAHNLKRCLSSVVEWVDEIVIVVNDCHDDTVKIAEEYGAKVHEHPWTCHRDQKNIALEKCQCDWVLAIDADEEVTSELAEELKNFSKDQAGFDGAFFPRMSFFLGKWIRHGDWYPDLSLRFFRRDKARWGGSQEHDKIELEGRSKKITHHLLHYSNPTINSQIPKISYFADIYLKRQLESRKTFSLINVLFRPAWRFFRSYVMRLGFLDGFPGFYIAITTAFSTFVRHSKLYEHKALGGKEGH